ncbi:MAG: hypothetical protein LBD29_10400, partial [Treponema sp.]|nr:hypothetical protein [Treponema sp.]
MTVVIFIKSKTKAGAFHFINYRLQRIAITLWKGAKVMQNRLSLDELHQNYVLGVLNKKEFEG